MDLVVLGGWVLHTERSGEGLQSIANDANLASNRWIYLYYYPPLDTPVDDPATPTANESDAPGFGKASDFARFKANIQLPRFRCTGKTDRLAISATGAPPRHAPGVSARGRRLPRSTFSCLKVHLAPGTGRSSPFRRGR
jgi:hypothetical protein